MNVKDRHISRLTWAVALFFLGIWAVTKVPLEWMPQVELPIVQISAGWTGASPRAIERYVATPIERIVQEVPGTLSIKSTSREGSAYVEIEVSDEVNLGLYTTEVNDRLAQLRKILPDRVYPQLTKRIPEQLLDQQGFMTLELIGPQSADVLRRFAEEQLAPKLRSVDGVAEVITLGGSERELLIRLDPDALARYGLQPDMITAALMALDQDTVFGRLRTQGDAILLLQPAIDDVELLRNVPLKAGTGVQQVRLRDVATVDLTNAPLRSISRINGQSVVTLQVGRSRGSHMLAAAAAVAARIVELEPLLLPQSQLRIAEDQSEEIRKQLQDLTWRGGLGLVLVILVLLFLLRNIRAMLVVLFSVGVALSVSFILLNPLGLTLNIITIAALVLVFGLLVDNAVVMVEQILLQRERLRAQGVAGLPLYLESVKAARQAVWVPLLGGTLSTMVVMFPLVYLSGELRTLFLPFGILVCITLAGSLIAAAVLVPILTRFLTAPTAHHGGRWLRRLSAVPYRWVARWPRLTFLVLLFALGLPVWLFPAEITRTAREVQENPWSVQQTRLAGLYNRTIGHASVQDIRRKVEPYIGGVTRIFLREVNFGQGWDREPRPEVYASLSFPSGNTIERADSLITRFEQVALASRATEQTIVQVRPEQATLRVQFTDAALATLEPLLVRERITQQAVGFAGINTYVGGLVQDGYFSQGMGGHTQGMTITAYGPNYEELGRWAEVLAERLKRSARVVEVQTNASGGWWGSTTREILRFDWTADAQARTGATGQDVAGLLRPVFSSHRPSYYSDLANEPHLPVRISVEGAEDLDINRVMHRPLTLSDSTQIRLAGSAEYQVEVLPTEIERENQTYKRYIKVDYRGPSHMGGEYIRKNLDELALPPGYRMTTDGGYFFTQEVAQTFGWVIFATIGLVFLVIASVFESWRLPFVVLLSVPMAAIGVGLGFLWTDADFAEGAFIGVILLVGIAVNDSILLVDRYRQLRIQRPHGTSAQWVRLAVRERLRPMWTTTLTSIMSMLPVIIFPEDGDFWIGLAVTVTGGLLASTLLSPLATVALLARSKRP